jgi:hypothetical protein
LVSIIVAVIHGVVASAHSGDVVPVERVGGFVELEYGEEKEQDHLDDSG